MTRLRIFIISGHLMFGCGLDSLLQQEVKFEIVGQEADVEQAIKQIKKLQPDVVIVDNDDSVPGVTHILRASPTVKVISLDLQSNDLYVYRAKQGTAKGIEDLVEAIEDDLPSLEATNAEDTSGNIDSGPST